MIRSLQDLHAFAAIPTKARLCKMELLPLTIGHVRIISALSLWGACTPPDLVLVAFICSRSASDFREALDSRWLALRLRIAAFRMPWWWDWKQAAKTWAEYTQLHTEQPVVVGKGKSRPSCMPMVQILRTRLCGSMGYDPQTFDDVPYTQALLDYWSLADVEDTATVTENTVSALREHVRSLRSN